jgi:hypothetical protein
MKKTTCIFLIITLFQCGLALAGDPRDGRGGGVDGGWGRDGGDGGFSRPPGDFTTTHSSNRWLQLGIHNVPRGIPNRSQILSMGREHSSLSLPNRGPDGNPLKASLVSPHAMNSALVRGHMGAIVRDKAFTGQVLRFNTTERNAGQYYWHNYNGLNFCHYYDRWGHHWYGWWLGGSFFWTQFYWGYWWWYDPLYYRWCYWYDGWWWWQDPYNVVYAYNDGQYVSGASPAPQGPVEYRSEDGTRMVKLAGGDAFLFDTSGSAAFKPVYLASGVKEVEFSKTQEGKPLQILVVLDDNSFELFDDVGNPLVGAPDHPEGAK